MHWVSVLNILVWAVMGLALAGWLFPEPPPKAEEESVNKGAWQRYAIMIVAALIGAALGYAVQTLLARSMNKEKLGSAGDDVVHVEIPTASTVMENATAPSESA